MQRKINPKQKRFVEEYASTGNATLSAKIAYGHESSNVAGATGSRLLRNVNVQAALNTSLTENGIDAPLVLETLKTNLLSGAGVNAKASDSNRAAELLIKVLGLTKDDGTTQISIKHQLNSLTVNELTIKKKELDQWFSGLALE